MERPTATIQSMLRGVSLATKCQLLFGAAIVLIIAAALLVPWLRTPTVVDASQVETSRQIARLWERVADTATLVEPDADERDDEPRIRYVDAAGFDRAAAESDFFLALL